MSPIPYVNTGGNVMVESKYHPQLFNRMLMVVVPRNELSLPNCYFPFLEMNLSEFMTSFLLFTDVYLTVYCTTITCIGIV